MNLELSRFAARLRGMIDRTPFPGEFNSLALELFTLQFQSNSAYAKICAARQLTPKTVGHWMQIPFVPTSAFKELELSSIPADERTAVFHSSGTTEQKPSRHFHCAESLAVYESSLWSWFSAHFSTENDFVILTPDENAAPRSSLVHMFETVRKKAACAAGFYGCIGADDVWSIDFEAVVSTLKSVRANHRPLTILGTAFSFVHLLDFLAEHQLQFDLPLGSRVMETGGYKNRSRTMPKTELHTLITKHLGVSLENIVCEYGMSELSSQAYDNVTSTVSPLHLDTISLSGERARVRGQLPSQDLPSCKMTQNSGAPVHASLITRHLHFPPWARVQIISPETGREVTEGTAGLIRILDLANVFSVAAIQTEDLGVRHGDGFELIGRAQLAESRGCSLMSA